MHPLIRALIVHQQETAWHSCLREILKQVFQIRVSVIDRDNDIHNLPACSRLSHIVRHRLRFIEILLQKRQHSGKTLFLFPDTDNFPLNPGQPPLPLFQKGDRFGVF